MVDAGLHYKHGVGNIMVITNLSIWWLCDEFDNV